MSVGDGEATVVDGRVELGNEEDDEVAVGMALSVVACLTWWCSARTAKLAIPAANSELSKTMATRFRSQAVSRLWPSTDLSNGSHEGLSASTCVFRNSSWVVLSSD